LIDLTLAPPFGFERLHGNAVRLHAAIATAFAHELVDDHALVGIREFATFAAAALFRSAGLIVDKSSNTGDGREFALNSVQLVTVINFHPLGEIDVLRIFPRLVGDEDNTLYVFCRDLPCDIVDREAALVTLTAGHRDRVVKQDLVGDIDA